MATTPPRPPRKGPPSKGRPGEGRPRRDDNGDGPRRSGGPGRPGQDSGSSRPRRSDGSSSTGRPGSEGRSARPPRDREAPRRDGAADRRPSRPPRSGGAESGGRGAPRTDRSRTPGRPERPSPDVDQSVVFPAVDPDITAQDFDRQARRELTSLDKDDAEFVMAHLVMAGRLAEENPELAHQHALAALSKGQRIPVVRETVGVTAYLTGDFALCLRELRTHRRLTGSDGQVPMMIDAERGLGRPQRGIELGRDVDRSALPAAVQVELAIALSGCRLDLGQTDKALVELQIPQLEPSKAFSYSPALFDAYAIVLEELGRTEEAAVWGERANRAAEALERAEREQIGEVVFIEDLSGDDSSGDDSTADDRGPGELGTGDLGGPVPSAEAP